MLRERDGSKLSKVVSYERICRSVLAINYRGAVALFVQNCQDLLYGSQCQISQNPGVGGYKSAVEIKQGLINQLTNPILWQKCMEQLLADGVERFYEIGPGRVLTGLMKRINRKIKVINVSNLQTIQELS